MKFRYQAKTKEGELQVGFVEAGTREAAVNILSAHDLFILKLEASERIHWFDRLSRLITPGVHRNDMVVFTRQLSTLLAAHLSLSKALATLYDQTSNPVLKQAVSQIANDVEAGLAFSQALERQGETFSTFFVSMVRSAEVTGNLDQVVGFLADYTEREAILITRAKSALIYPSIVIGLFVVVSILMITVVFPQIEPIFREAGVPLPIFSQIVISIGHFFSRWWPAVVLALVILLAVLIDYLETPEGRGVKDDLKVRLPTVQRVYLPITIARFANASAVLLKGGVPVAQAMEIVAETVENVLYRDLLHEISEDVRQGKPLSESIAKHPDYFPALVSQMLAVGETTGQMDQMFARIANFYNQESEGIVNNLVGLIQPILMIGIGILVALLFASILLPLYQLTAAIH